MAQKELITMTNKEGGRYEIIKNLIDGKINGTEASKQIGLCVRQIKNIKARVIKEGLKGIVHKGRGRSGNRRMPETQIDKIELIVKTKYHDFGPTLAAEKLDELHGMIIGKEKLRQLMIGWDLWKPKPRKANKEYRHWRQRKEYYGEMEQFDGSYHRWFEDRAPECCLLASIDDAKKEITRLEFGRGEGVIPVFTFWKGYVERKGKPISVYLDRHSTYKQNQKSVFDDPNSLTQFQRAMEIDLGVKIIHAYSPQGKGRVERLFKTLQDRLIKEMRLAGISTIEEGNKFAEEIFIPKFNAKFSVVPQKKRNLHKPLTKFESQNLDKIFSIYDARVVNNDFTVRFKCLWFQLSKIQSCLVLRKDRVQIEERIDGQIFISLRNKYLNYTLLPGRPEKINVKPAVSKKIRYTWKPAADHPWRKPFVVEPNYGTSTRRYR